jgi:hypothetical protein
MSISIEQNKTYLVKITDDKHTHYSKTAEVIFKGIYLHSTKSKNKLLLWQCEVIKEVIDLPESLFQSE